MADLTGTSDVAAETGKAKREPKTGFVTEHNIAGYLMDPPKKSKTLFYSMIVGLNLCRITHAVRENPPVCKTWIENFWGNARVITKGGVQVISFTVQNKEVIISEQIIREVLLFGDKPEDPVVYPDDTVKEVLRRMSYEGGYPTVQKKLMHPYWRFLVHVYLMCISGNKGGSDSLNRRQASGVVALVMDWDYNYSKYVFEEMLGNLKGVKKNLFMMYPRFIQMILDAKYKNLERTVGSFDVKMMGSNVFGLISQERKGAKEVYKKEIPLEKFGHFAEVALPEHEQERNVNATVAEDHDVQIIDPPPGSKEETMIENIEVSDDELYGDLPEKNTGGEINEVLEQEQQPELEHQLSMTETSTVSIPVLSSELLSTLVDKTKVGVENPPLTLEFASSEEVDPEPERPLKRRRRDSRPGVLINEPSLTQPAVEVSVDVLKSTEPSVKETEKQGKSEVADQSSVEKAVEAEPQVTNVTTLPETPFLSFVHTEPGSSSGAGGSESTSDIRGKTHMLEELVDEFEDVDVVDLKRRVIVLEKEQILKDVRIINLEETIKEKDKQIKELQINMGNVFTIVTNLTQKMENRFGLEFKEKNIRQTSPGTSGVESESTENKEVTLEDEIESDFGDFNAIAAEGLRKYLENELRPNRSKKAVD